MIEFIVPYPPFGKERHKLNKKTGGVYLPDRTKNYEACVAQLAKASMKGKSPMEGGVIVKINAYYPIPKNTSKKKRKLMEDKLIRPLVKPDGDNVAKAVLDGMNKVVYCDDNQVVTLITHKWYGSEPHVKVTVRSWECDLSYDSVK